jgi:hypothetical protein
VAISTKYVKGEADAINLPQLGSFSIGIKTPLMNRRGNLTRVESIITLAGISVGGVDKIAARDEKQKEADKIPKRKIIGCSTVTPRTRPITSGTSEKRTPNRKDAKTSPNIMAVIDTGLDTSLSRVLDLVSQGMTKGTTAVDVKKMVMTVRLDIKKLRLRSLPTRKAANIKVGNSIPMTMTGLLR